MARKKKLEEVAEAPVREEAPNPHQIPIIFRVDEGILRQMPEFALYGILPTIPWDDMEIFVVVVHSNMKETAASYNGCILQSREATPEEYEPFLNKLLSETTLPLVATKHNPAMAHDWYKARCERAAMRAADAKTRQSA